MKTVRNAMLLLWGVLICYPIGMKAQDKFDASVGMDLVSGYIWRGQDLGNVSIQPEVSLAYKGFSLTGWGTVGFDKDDIKEFDLTLGYEVKGFSCSVTDYWTNGGPGYFHYGAHNTSHTFEAQIGYDFGFLSVDWFTNFAGNIGYKADGSKAYASYFSVSVPFVLGGLDWTVEAGATPWENDFYTGGENSSYSKDMINGFAVCEVGIEASKEIKISESWSLPLFAKAIWNPSTEGLYFVAGLSFYSVQKSNSLSKMNFMRGYLIYIFSIKTWLVIDLL